MQKGSNIDFFPAGVPAKEKRAQVPIAAAAVTIDKPAAVAVAGEVQIGSGDRGGGSKNSGGSRWWWR